MEASEELEFDGRFTEEIRARMRARREEQGLSRCSLAKLLNVHRVTIRKWEEGFTPCCHKSLVSLVKAFLNGHVLPIQPPRDNTEFYKDIPEEFQVCMEQIVRIYELSAKSSPLRSLVLKRLDDIADEAEKGLSD